MLKTSCAFVALIALANPAMAATTCASQADAAALKTAVMQQELMVAGLQCHEAESYNRFVIAYRSELQDSDATLKSYFVRRDHGEAGYDTFKTKAANMSALEQARDIRSFCADAHALFSAAMENRGSLASFVDARGTDIGNVCTQSRPVMMAVADKPPIAAPTKPVAVVSIADVHGGQADVKAKTAVAQADAVSGVPDHAAPMMPWRHSDTPRADRRDDRDDYDDQDEARARSAAASQDDLPPPRAHAMEIRDQEDDGYYGNAPYADRPQTAARGGDDRYGPQAAYGPPQNWYPSRRARWTPPPGYYNW
jgi:hypothetical protein